MSCFDAVLFSGARAACTTSGRPRTSSHPAFAALLLAIGALATASAPGAESAAPAGQSARRVVESTTLVSPPPQRTALRYDYDYPTIGYANKPTHNPIARLQEQLDKGAIKLEYRGPRGYLDSILKALGIDPSSQTFVFSKTSLQFTVISAATPRAIYFNDDTYVAYVQHSDLLEFNTMDSRLGPVFYTLVNRKDLPPTFDRETSRCLACHDTFSMMGGGVPRFLVMSSIVNANGEPVTNDTSTEITDSTPIEQRWAGWYVTGHEGAQQHMGNIIFRSADDLEHVDQLRRANLDTLQGLFDTSPYLTDKSDVVALLVLEHQLNAHNAITRVQYKSRTMLARNGESPDVPSWADVSPKMQRALKPMLETLLHTLLFVNEAPMKGPIRSGSGFDKWFEAQGPRDPRGRSLRDLDLKTRLFRYPLSYLVYSEAFDALPACTRDYVYQRLRAIFTGKDTSPEYAHLSPADRKALLEILTATKPDFAHGLKS